MRPSVPLRQSLLSAPQIHLIMPKVKIPKGSRIHVRDIEYVPVMSRRGSQRLKMKDVSTSPSPPPLPPSPSKSLRSYPSPSKAQTFLKHSDDINAQDQYDGTEMPGVKPKPKPRDTKVSYDVCFLLASDLFSALTEPT